MLAKQMKYFRTLGFFNIAILVLNHEVFFRINLISLTIRGLKKGAKKFLHIYDILQVHLLILESPICIFGKTLFATYSHIET